MRLRLAHASDFHFTTLTFNPFRLMSKRFFGVLNWIFNRDKEFSSHQVRRLVPLFSELNVDWVLLGGDFTSTAMREEYENARHFVQELKQPWIALPGNHDHYTKRSFRNRLFYRYLANVKSDRFSLAQDGLEAHSIAPGWWVIALDTARPTHPASSNGLFSEALEQKLEQLLSEIPPSDKVILFNHYPFFHNDPPKKRMIRGEALEQLLRRHPNILLYLHGHTHRHTIANVQPHGLPLVLDSGSCAQGPQGAWNLLDIDDNGCTITVYRWNEMWYPSRTEHFAWKK